MTRWACGCMNRPFTPERVLAALRAKKNAKPINLTEGVDPTNPCGIS